MFQVLIFLRCVASHPNMRIQIQVNLGIKKHADLDPNPWLLQLYASCCTRAKQGERMQDQKEKLRKRHLTPGDLYSISFVVRKKTFSICTSLHFLSNVGIKRIWNISKYWSWRSGFEAYVISGVCRLLCGRVSRVREWIAHRLPFPVLMLIHGRLLANMQARISPTASGRGTSVSCINCPKQQL